MSFNGWPALRRAAYRDVGDAVGEVMAVDGRAQHRVRRPEAERAADVGLHGARRGRRQRHDRKRRRRRAAGRGRCAQQAPSDGALRGRRHI